MNQQELTLQMKTACFHNAYVQQEEDITPLYEKAAQKANGKPFISEIVYRMDQPSAAQRLIRAGMEEYSRLVYMTRTPDRVSNTGGGTVHTR